MRMQEKENVSFRNNGLNLMRLIAAFQVMYFHMITHLNIDIPAWISKPIAFIFGVPVFFGISGFLVWRSAENCKGFHEYAIKRSLRIFPELWVAVCIEIIAILLTYEKSVGGGTQLIVFAICQGTVFQFWTPDFLRGYGCGTPNGALWTIGVIIQSYIVLYFVSKMAKGQKWKWWIASLGVSILFAIGTRIIYPLLPSIFSKLLGQTFIPYFWMFLLGAMLSNYFEQIVPYLKKLWYVFLFVSLLCVVTRIDINADTYGIVRCGSLISGLIGFAYAFPKINLKIDISYPLYLYHMTVVNVMLQLGYSGKRIHLLIAIMISCLFAFISTETIGTLANRIKLRL